jgi:hypothetical protein
MHGTRCPEFGTQDSNFKILFQTSSRYLANKFFNQGKKVVSQALLVLSCKLRTAKA